MSDTITPERKPVEQLAQEAETPAWLLAAARAYHQWPIGREMSPDEFSAAIDEVQAINIGGR